MAERSKQLGGVDTQQMVNEQSVQRSPFEYEAPKMMVWGRSKAKSKYLLSPEELQAQQEEKLRLAALQANGAPENTEEKAEEVEQEVESNPGPTEMEAAVDAQADEQNEQLQMRIAREQAIMAQVRDAYARINDKLDKEIALERDRGKNILALRNAWNNSRSSAISYFGPNADLKSIDQSFQKTMDSVNPRIHDVTDIVSMEIDKAIHGTDNGKVLMSDGSVRIMDSEIASYLNSMNPSNVRESISIDEVNEYEPIPAEQFARLEVETPEYQAELNQLQNDTREKLEKFQGMMAENQRQSLEFESELYASTSPARSAQAARKARELPTVAYEYPQLFQHNDVEYNGRPLPEPMSSPTMQRELAETGRYIDNPYNQPENEQPSM